MKIKEYIVFFFAVVFYNKLNDRQVESHTHHTHAHTYTNILIKAQIKVRSSNFYVFCSISVVKIEKKKKQKHITRPYQFQSAGWIEVGGSQENQQVVIVVGVVEVGRVVQQFPKFGQSGFTNFGCFAQLFDGDSLHLSGQRFGVEGEARHGDGLIV